MKIIKDSSLRPVINFADISFSYKFGTGLRAQNDNGLLINSPDIYIFYMKGIIGYY